MSGRGILLVVAIVIAVFTVISLRHAMEQPPERPPAEAPRVVIARRDLPAGAFVQGEQDLEFGRAPAPAGDEANAPPAAEALLMEGAVALSEFNGAVVRRPLRAGQPVPKPALMKAGEGGFMSAVLEPGMRAVSIAVNATTGNAGFVSPGDRVDLIVTYRFKNAAAPSAGNDETVVSETFVHALRVVAVDQMLDNPENKAILAKTVTVECSPREAEQIAVASEMGKLSLALRSLSSAPGNAAVKTEGKTEGKTEDGSGGAAPQDGAVPSIAALYGEDATTRTRDSDVSRLLERRSLQVPRVLIIRGDKSEIIDFAHDFMHGAP